MGLDIVELVMEVEEAFGVSLPDDRAGEIQTVGDLYEFLLEATRDKPRGSGVCLSAATFYAIRRVVHSRLGTQSWIHPRQSVHATLPKTGRRATWRGLARELDLKLPPLSRPAWLVTSCCVVLAVLCGWIAFLAYRHIGSGSVVLATIGALTVGGIAAAILTSPFATVPRSEIATFRSLSSNVAAMNHSTLCARYNSWNPADVWNTLRVIIVDQLGVRPEAVTKKAHFAKDLGAG